MTHPTLKLQHPHCWRVNESYRAAEEVLVVAAKAIASLDVTKRLDANNTISLAAATRLLAERICGSTAARDRTTLNRVRNRLKYAVKHGHLPAIGEREFAFEALAHWATGIWPDQLADWARFHTTSGSARGLLDDFTARIEGVCLPPIPDDPRDLVLRLSQELASSRRENAVLCAEISELRPYKVRYEEFRKNARTFGRRGGRGNRK
jgi:hypothetical protein